MGYKKNNNCDCGYGEGCREGMCKFLSVNGNEVGQMLHVSALPVVKRSWQTEAQDHLKLDVLQKLLVDEYILCIVM